MSSSPQNQLVAAAALGAWPLAAVAKVAVRNQWPLVVGRGPGEVLKRLTVVRPRLVVIEGPSAAQGKLVGSGGFRDTSVEADVVDLVLRLDALPWAPLTLVVARVVTDGFEASLRRAGTACVGAYGEHEGVIELMAGQMVPGCVAGL